MNQRTEFVLRAIKTENFRELCQEFGISPKTGYKWKERFLERGLSGLAEETRRPKSSPGGLGEGVICEIIRIKERHRHWGPRKIRAVYARNHQEVPSESSFKRVLSRAGLVEERRARKRQEAGSYATAERAVSGPNDLWTVDFKGWWYGSQGHRCEPLTVRDKYSRYILDVRGLANARTQTVRESFERLFKEQGLPAAIRSDNGAPFASMRGVCGLTRLSAWWIVLGIDLERGRPGCPQDNGAHERMHLDVFRELELAKMGEHQSDFDEWRREFNFERPHQAIEMRCPAELYQPSPRKYAETPEDITYEGMLSRRVCNNGAISWEGEWLFISSALYGWSVGLEPKASGNWHVWFGRLLLGELEPATRSFRPSHPQTQSQEEKTASGEDGN